MLVHAFTPSSLLRAVPNRVDNHALAPHSVEDGVGRSPDNQLANSMFSSNSPQVRVRPQSLDHRHNSSG
jgi:hypothetical protein